MWLYRNCPEGGEAVGDITTSTISLGLSPPTGASALATTYLLAGSDRSGGRGVQVSKGYVSGLRWRGGDGMTVLEAVPLVVATGG